MKSVYAVTRGEYSDYVVMCVCDDGDTAHGFAKAYNAEEARSDNAKVEEFPFFRAGDNPEKQVFYRGQLLFKNGVSKGKRYWSYDTWNFDGLHDPPPNPALVKNTLFNDSVLIDVFGSNVSAVESALEDAIGIIDAAT